MPARMEKNSLTRTCKHGEKHVDSCEPAYMEENTLNSTCRHGREHVDVYLHTWRKTPWLVPVHMEKNTLTGSCPRGENTMTALLTWRKTHWFVPAYMEKNSLILICQRGEKHVHSYLPKWSFFTLIRTCPHEHRKTRWLVSSYMEKKEEEKKKKRSDRRMMLDEATVTDFVKAKECSWSVGCWRDLTSRIAYISENLTRESGRFQGIFIQGYKEVYLPSDINMYTQLWDDAGDVEPVTA